MRVFISSTYVDLVEHRLAVADAIERLGLSLSRMETLGSRTESPSQACLEEVESSDIFVGVYAHRYGYVPSCQQSSITEDEFNHAYKLRRPTFCFLVDPEYPWPEHLIESEPGLSHLVAFKHRLSTLVVRDTFTTPAVLATRVVSALGRYLLADPRRHGAAATSDQVRASLTDAASMCFVDVMRITSVAASSAARSANLDRYPEFVDLADEHLAELLTQITRLTVTDEPSVMDTIRKVEHGIAWAIGRLRRTPELDRPWLKFASILVQVAERVESLGKAVSPDYYSSRLAEIASPAAAIGAKISAASSPDDFVRARFSTQSLVLAEVARSGKFALATVRDDMDHRLAIPYFAIDLALLRRATKEMS